MNSFKPQLLYNMDDIDTSCVHLENARRIIALLIPMTINIVKIFDLLLSFEKLLNYLTSFLFVFFFCTLYKNCKINFYLKSCEVPCDRTGW
jgi:hypothetical protein